MSFSDRLSRVQKAIGITTYRTPYEVQNAYEANITELAQIEASAKASISSGENGSTNAALNVVLDDVRKLRSQWEEKWNAYQHAKNAQSELDAADEAQLQAEEENWLKQKAAEEAAEKESQKNKAAIRKQKMAKKKANKRRNMAGVDSDSSDEEGATAGTGEEGQRGSKTRNDTGMERGSSLTAHLAALSGKPQNPAGSAGASPTTSSPPAGSPTTATAPTPTAYRAEYKNIPFSFVPPVLFEGNGPINSSSPLCTLTPVENTPLVELHFTTPVNAIPLPPKRPVAQPKKGQGNKGKGRGKGGDKEKKEPAVPIEGNFKCTLVVHRVLVAAQQTIPQTQQLDANGDVHTNADSLDLQATNSQLSDFGGVVGAGEGGDDEEEMVLEETPDWEGGVGGEDDDEDLDSDEEAERRQRMVIAQNRLQEANLQELSQQLIAQYSEVEEEDELGRHAKARDMPPMITRALSHWKMMSESTWVVLMCHGGYFAGAVFVNRQAVLHKAFHRYVVRKKQGGKQSKHDKGGGSMSSAGGQIRRHHELKWKATVRDIVLTWKAHIDAASLILYVAPGPDNRAILTDFKDTPSSALSLNMGPAALISPIDVKDPRVRSAPMTTHRPVFSEVKRIYETVSNCTIRFEDAE